MRLVSNEVDGSFSQRTYFKVSYLFTHDLWVKIANWFVANLEDLYYSLQLTPYLKKVSSL